MRVSKKLLYANTVALLVNVIIVWLTLVHLFAPLFGGLVLLLVLLGAVWCSCYVNGYPLRRGHNSLRAQHPPLM